VVLYLGNMGQGHEFATALAAAEALGHEPVTFLFIGGGGRQREVKAQAEQRGLSNVVVTDYVPQSELRSAMASAGCTLISLRNDCLGVMSPSKLHANLAMGLPVLFIGPEGCNVDEAIQRFACGVSLRTGDVEAVVRFVREGLKGSAEFQGYRMRARAAFESTYCDARALLRFDEMLEGLSP
jgi:glycosyltransferase involved in cell wall biosynthesis